MTPKQLAAHPARLLALGGEPLGADDPAVAVLAYVAHRRLDEHVVVVAQAEPQVIADAQRLRADEREAALADVVRAHQHGAERLGRAHLERPIERISNVPPP